MRSTGSKIRLRKPNAARLPLSPLGSGLLIQAVAFISCLASKRVFLPPGGSPSNR
ncbi:unnamed protein product [Amoebophrya sp. A120]|nr:unnamed protein product [Amoebophrya sp. A120]|eukprot:GSA120T00007558001.1